MRLILFHAAVVLLAATAVADDRVIIHVQSDGWPVPVSELPTNVGDREAVWTWSASCSPERLTSIRSIECRRGKRVTIRIAPRDKRHPPETEVRWGTEQMLRELPDALLPVARLDAAGAASVEVPDGERLFVRVAGPTLASSWTAVRFPSTTLKASSAAAVSSRILEHEGRPAARARLEIRTTDAPQPGALRFWGGGSGRVTIPPLPANAFVKAIAWSDGGAPVIIAARAGAFPSEISLPSGFTLRGQVIDGNGTLIRDARVRLLLVLPEHDFAIKKDAATDAEGRFTIPGVGPGGVEWSIVKPGFARAEQIVSLKSDHDLGPVVLQRQRAVMIHVRDQRGEPVAALLTTDTGVESKADRDGVALLHAVPAASFRVIVSAKGYIKREITIEDGAKDPVEIVLRSAARLRARLVRTDDGASAGPGTAAIEIDGAKRLEEFDETGQLDIDLRDGGATSVEIRANGLAPYRIPSRRVEPEENVDLGTIELASGLAILGRVVEEETAAPLADVTLSVLRPSDFGPLLSYARADWVKTQSGGDGTFRIEGLAPGIYTLWSEASGRAPMVKPGLTVGDDLPNSELDIGDLAVPLGRTVAIDCSPAARCGTEASLVIADAEWLPLGGPMIEGRARVAPLPPGPSVLRLSDARGILHEREIVVSAEEPSTQVEVRLPTVRVRGSVVRAGRPVSGGSVTFSVFSTTSARFVQIARVRNTGTIGSRFVGSVPRTTIVAVSGEGTFETEDLAPGEYRVAWSSGGSNAPPRRITIPEAAEANVRIELPAGRLQGRVVTDDGTPPPRTLVTMPLADGDLRTVAAADGTFNFDGLPAGSLFVRASALDGSEAEKRVEIQENRTAEVELTLGRGESLAIEVSVRGNGLPLPNAFVFARQRGGMRALMTSAAGEVNISRVVPHDPLEIAVYVPRYGWKFPPPTVVTTGTTMVLDVEQSGASVSVRAKHHSGRVAIVAPTGFRIDDALQLVGVHPVIRDGSTFRLEGLPPGTYNLSVGGVQRTFRVGREATEIEF